MLYQKILLLHKMFSIKSLISDNEYYEYNNGTCF